jgi:hypothetical protein
VFAAPLVYLDEINANLPAMPGDTRPITYQITPHRI